MAIGGNPETDLNIHMEVDAELVNLNACESTNFKPLIQFHGNCYSCYCINTINSRTLELSEQFSIRKVLVCIEATPT